MSIKTRGTYFYSSEEWREREKEIGRTREIKKNEKKKERARECNSPVATTSREIYLCRRVYIYMAGDWR